MGILTLLSTGSAPLWIAGGLLAASAAFGTVQTLHLANARTALADEQRDRAAEHATAEQAALAQAERFRATEQNWNEVQHENATIASNARALVAVDAAAAGTAAERLRGRAAAVAATCRGPARDPAAVAASAAASAPGDLLTDVFGRMDAAARLVVAYADAAGISSEQCAADYQTLRTAAPPTKGQP